MYLNNKSIFDLLSFHIVDENIVDETILERWVEQAIVNDDYSFETGLLGIAWYISFLIENNYLVGDPDEILADLDDLIYKLTLKEVLQESIHVEKHLNLITYYQQRIGNDSKDHIYNRFTHFECLKLLIARLNEVLLDPKSFDQKELPLIIDILLKYSYLAIYVTDESLLEKPFYSSIENILDRFILEHVFIENVFIAKLFLCVKQYDNRYWWGKFQKILQSNGSNETSLWSELYLHIGETDLKDVNLKHFMKYDMDSKTLFDFVTNTNVYGD